MPKRSARTEISLRALRRFCSASGMLPAVPSGKIHIDPDGDVYVTPDLDQYVYNDAYDYARRQGCTGRMADEFAAYYLEQHEPSPAFTPQLQPPPWFVDPGGSGRAAC